MAKFISGCPGQNTAYLKDFNTYIVPCPKCGKKMIVREGKHGKFYGCSGYPDCTYTENIKE